MGPDVVVEADVVANEPEQVALAEDDDVIDQLASDRSGEPLGEAVLTAFCWGPAIRGEGAQDGEAG